MDDPYLELYVDISTDQSEVKPADRNLSARGDSRPEQTAIRVGLTTDYSRRFLLTRAGHPNGRAMHPGLAGAASASGDEIFSTFSGGIHADGTTAPGFFNYYVGYSVPSTPVELPP